MILTLCYMMWGGRNLHLQIKNTNKTKQSSIVIYCWKCSLLQISSGLWHADANYCTLICRTPSCRKAHQNINNTTPFYFSCELKSKNVKGPFCDLEMLFLWHCSVDIDKISLRPNCHSNRRLRLRAMLPALSMTKGSIRQCYILSHTSFCHGQAVWIFYSIVLVA